MSRIAAKTIAAGALILALAAFATARSDTERIRPPALAGSWYPDGKAALLAAAHLLMRVGAPGEQWPAKPLVLVVPHAGWDYSGAVAGAAYRRLRPGDFDRVVVMAPAHQAAFRGYALDDASAYRTPLGEVPLCPDAIASLRGPEAATVANAFGPEHAIEVELPFLQTALDAFCLVPLLVGDTDTSLQRAFASRLAKLDDGRTLFVFSSDFSHYGPRFDYQPFGALSAETKARVRALDEQALALLSRADLIGFQSYLRKTGNTICGRNGLATLLELLPHLTPRAQAVTLAHYASSDIPGLLDDSAVGYAALAWWREGQAPAVVPLLAPPRLADAPSGTPALDTEAGRRLVRLARAALETELRGADTLERELRSWPSGPEQERRRGVFVTLNRTDATQRRARGRLRGCIGQPEPTYPLYYATVRAALDAALHDSRFEPVRPAELSALAVEVTVLSPRQPIASPREIRLGTHGVVLQKAGKAALFLPQVAREQGWDTEALLEALGEKAGLPRGAWREGAQLSVFTGQVFEEHP